MTTFNSDSSSSSLSSQRFALDPNSRESIIVYKVREGCHICTQKELCDKLDEDPFNFRCSRVAIPRGASRVHIQTKDLWNDAERKKWSDYPNASLSVASVGLPRTVYWRRMMMNEFRILYIVSPDHSPASSEDPSPNSSQHVSPANTFPITEART